MSLKVITDSAADLPKWFLEEFDLDIISIPIIIDNKEDLNSVSINPVDFYNKMRENVVVKTSQVNVFTYRDIFEPYAKNGDQLVYICFSSGLTGTFSAANLAKEELLGDYPDFDITIIDTKSAASGMGQIVCNAMTVLRHGISKEELIKTIEYDCNHIEHIFTVESLEYLYRGGRLSKTSAVVGGLLDIKPIIVINNEGKLVPIENVRGRNKALKKMVDMVGERCKDPKEQVIGICHGDDNEALEKVKKMLNNKYGCEKFFETYVGCAIGAHVGPGILGITFMGNGR